jgi:nucleotide-binding universal stress UspA family protein
MSAPPLPDAILVAVDFSPCSLRALDTAIAWRKAEADLTVLHVVDVELARRMERTNVTSFQDAMARMKARAEEELTRLREERREVAFETMVVEGVPFLEIIRIASDLECPLIVLGSRGSTGGLEHVLFGSTAEKVLRGARHPVLCVP